MKSKNAYNKVRSSWSWRYEDGLEAGTSEMMNEYRTRLYANASEYAHVMTSAMWHSIACIKSFHHSAYWLPAARDGPRRSDIRENIKEQIARFHLIRKAIPPHDGKKLCFQNDGQGLPGRSQYVFQEQVLSPLSRRSRTYR
jgi:hypothetical protein